MTELGEHRLKDFAEPVALYQLGVGVVSAVEDDLEHESAAAGVERSSGGTGRWPRLCRSLREGARLVTLTGPGGSGKTRLAIEAAGELVPRVQGRRVLGRPRRAARSRTRAGDDQRRRWARRRRCVSYIGDRELLLLLDNLEQVVEAAPELAALVEACPKPAAARHVTGAAARPRRGGVRTSCRWRTKRRSSCSAHEHRSSPASPSRSCAGVWTTCRSRSSWPPLARRVLTIEQILERLSTAPRPVQGRPRRRSAPADAPRHDRVVATTCSRRRNRLCSRGWRSSPAGATLEAAEEVADADLETLQSLVDKSLVRRTNDRFWMLETIREFALERLDESQDAIVLRARHARFLLAFAEEAKSHLAGERQAEWLERIADERDNIRVALAWALDRGEEVALRLAAALRRFWWVRAHAEGLAWLRRGLARDRRRSGCARRRLGRRRRDGVLRGRRRGVRRLFPGRTVDLSRARRSGGCCQDAARARAAVDAARTNGGGRASRTRRCRDQSRARRQGGARARSRDPRLCHGFPWSARRGQRALRGSGCACTCHRRPLVAGLHAPESGRADAGRGRSGPSLEPRVRGDPRGSARRGSVPRAVLPGNPLGRGRQARRRGSCRRSLGSRRAAQRGARRIGVG